MKKKRRVMTSIIALMAGMASAPVLAQEEAPFVPHIEGELSVEFESDNSFKHDDPTAEITDTYATIGLAAGFMFTPNLSVQAGFTVEPVDEEPPAGDLTFHGHGGYIDTLFLQYETGPVRLFAGKFGASFGQAWDLTPGLYGTDFAEDYELAEQLGLGAAVTVEGTPVGNLTLTGNVFTADTSGLSSSIFFSRGRTTVRDGVGNTGNLDSYSMTLDGNGIALLGGEIAWHVGYSSLAKGDQDNDQNSFVGGLYGSHKLSESLSLEWVGEIAQLQNVEGGDNDTTYYTAGAVITFAEKFNVAIAHTTRSTDVAGGPDVDDKTTQFSAGMEVYDGWAVDIGYKMVEEAGDESQTVGVLLSKTFEFNTGG